MIEIVVTAPFAPELLEKLRAVSSQIKIEQVALTGRRWPEDKEMTAEVYYASGGLPPLEQAPNLRWVQMHWAGVDHLRDQPIWQSDMLLTSASGIHAPNIGQYVISQILHWAQRIPRWRQYQQKSEWPSDRWQKLLPDDLHGRTLGILGYGGIGREVARLGKQFGLTVLAVKQNAKTIQHQGYVIPGYGDPEGVMADRIYPSEAIRSVLAESDYLVVTLPLTSRTHHLLNETLLREMKPNAFLINVGRGSVIKEADLVKALRKGWLAGAGLDVFEQEPLPADSPLWSMDNVIISPHVSGFTPHYNERAVDLFAQNIRRYLSGERLLNQVDRQREY
jgi:phosphoglycerate dehydrogenase-like enzyme